MKKSHIQYIVFSLIIMVLFVLNVLQNKKKDNISHTESGKPKQGIEYEAKEKNQNHSETYTWKADNEQIFLYDNEENVIQKLNIEFNNLREYDKKMFVEGIYFDNIEDVYFLIEDFSS